MSEPTAAVYPNRGIRTRGREESRTPGGKSGGRAQALALRGAVYAAAGFTFFILIFLIGYILVRGIPYLTPDLFSLEYTSDNCSMMPAIVTTLKMTGLSLLIAIPISVFTAVYLVEYAKRGNKLVKVVRLTAETLSGIPSIVYGLFGYLMFVIALNMDKSMLAGALTLAIMILPTILRTTEEALKAVPDSFREGSFGLGAGRLRTMLCVVLPAAVPGILSGVILAVGRIVGETAALMYTAGTVEQIAGMMDSGITLSVHMYRQASEGLYTEQAYATAVVLLALVLLINLLAGRLAASVTKGRQA